jgi:phage tail sheath protein FI
MPITPTYPGVYIQEIPSSVHPITGVATSIAAFIDFFKRGPMNKAVQIFNMGDFEREFGGLEAQSQASYAIQQFFLNGGTEAWVVRVASGSVAPANVQIDDVIPAVAAALTVTAISEGDWGQNLRVRVDNNTPTVGEFNLTISEYTTVNGRTAVTRQEVFRNLSMNNAQTNFVHTVVNDPNTGSKLVRVLTNGANAPLANGTFSGAHVGATAHITSAAPAVSVTIGTGGASNVTATATFTVPTPNPFPGNLTLARLAPMLEAALRAAAPANPAFAGATVSVVGNQLYVLAGSGNTDNRVTFANVASDQTAADLLLTTAARANLQEYRLGGGSIANTAQLGGTVGSNGSPPNGNALIGDLASKRGIFALEDVDLFNLLCIPRAAMVGGTGGLTPLEAQAVLTVAETYCENRRAFFLMDTPIGVDEPQEIKNTLPSLPRHRNAALYYPRVRIPDPLNNFRLRSVGASGTIAGLCARTDSSRGVWKAPAGTEAVLRNVSELENVLTDQEHGTLNPLAINCLRTFPIYGTVCWGARTLDGSDQQASEWKYVPVRRLALFLEESLYRGTKWVVFEPNDEQLWAQIRLNVGAFMQSLFRQGAFQGKTPSEAYLVKCDNETTTQADIDRGYRQYHRGVCSSQASRIRHHPDPAARWADRTIRRPIYATIHEAAAPF